MQYGTTGVYVEVDLSQGKIEKKAIDPKMIEAFLGGKGTSTKFLWDRVPPEVEPFSEENHLVFSAGILAGTLVPGANRTCITSRSPQTNLFTYGAFGGFFAPELKHAGYDTIIISGKSPVPVYLWIKDDKVELREATHLWGKDTFETPKLIKEELKENKAQVACIGPAGENRVYSASIEHGVGTSSSRTGIGAVMGDKKLKAIAVYGTKDVNVADGAKLTELCEKIFQNKRHEAVREVFDNFWEYGSTMFVPVGLYGNMGSLPFPEGAQDPAYGKKLFNEFLQKCKVKKEVACYNCGLHCKASLVLPGGEHLFGKCGSFMSFLINCKIMDFAEAARCYYLCEKYGMDEYSTANYVSFAIDLYKKGIINIEDTDGLELEYGDVECALKMIEKVAKREGIGNALANGVYNASQLIGRGAEEFAYHVKKLELPPIDISYPAAAVGAAISDRQDWIKAFAVAYEDLPFQTDEKREEYVKSEFFHYPKELADFMDYKSQVLEYDKFLHRFLCVDEDLHNIADVTGICWFWTGFLMHAPIRYDMMAELIACVTGMDFDVEKANRVSDRITNLIKSYNLMLGLRRKDDKLPEKFYKLSRPSGLPALDPDKINKAVEGYYEIRGWNKEGIPKKEKLEELGLNYVAQELERRGIM